jgi:hypothetical protein
MINAADYPCLQYALDASLNVFIPTGIYVDQPLTFRTGHRVTGEGRGTVLKATSATGNGILLNCSHADNVELSNLAIDIDPACANLVGLQVQNSTGSHFKKIVFTNSGQSFGVYSQDCEDCIFDYIEVPAAKIRCIQHSGGVRIKTRYHKLSCPGADHCIQIYGGILNDVKDGYVGNSPCFGVSYYRTDGGDCSGNKSMDTRLEAYQITDSSNVRIHGNDARWSLGVSLDFGISVHGETFYPPNVAPTRYFANANQIYDNTVMGCGKSGVALAGNAIDNHAYDNTIIDPCRLGESFSAGILMYGQYCQNNFIDNNTISTYVTPATSKMLYGIAEGNSDGYFSSNNRVGCNKVTGAKSATSYLQPSTVSYSNY